MGWLGAASYIAFYPYAYIANQDILEEFKHCLEIHNAIQMLLKQIVL